MLLVPFPPEGAVVFTAMLVAVAGLAGAVTARLPQIATLNTHAITAVMNCRGLMLLALAVQMSDHDLIGPRLLAVLFIGAVATTLMTGPLLERAAAS